MPAEVKVLVKGYYSMEGGQENTRPTISLVLDEGIIMVVDPGVLENQQILTDALKKEGLELADVNLVCLTHSHIDHYRNVGMFPKAKVLEYFGLWNGGRPQDWQEQFTDNIRIIKTPGHDYTSLTLFIRTGGGVVAICGDVFWGENYPEVDPYASDLKKLEKSRKLVLGMSQWIIPGHAGMYETASLLAKRSRTPLNLPAKRNGKILGNCKKCHRPFLKQDDRCACQEWLCYRCCECEDDCMVCNCSHKS